MQEKWKQQPLGHGRQLLELLGELNQPLLLLSIASLLLLYSEDGS